MCRVPKIEFTNQKNPFPLPFLDKVVRHKMYSFIDGYNGHSENDAFPIP
jgi:hypothetical protein